MTYDSESAFTSAADVVSAQSRQRKNERLCKCCGDPKPSGEFRVVGPPGRRHRLNTCKGCQRRLGLGAACQ